MLERTIEYCARNTFIVFLVVVFFVGLGFLSLQRVPLDAIPDLSDVQVIIFTEWPGRAPSLVEEQITYPIVTAMLSAPKSTVVRGKSMFGFSFVYVLFEDDTDIYWARSRVLEYMNTLAGQLPEGVSPRLGPDATGVGWGFEYALVDKTGNNDLQELRAYQDYHLRYSLSSIDGVAEVASVGGFQKQYQIVLDPERLQAYHLSIKHIIMAVRASNNDVGGRTLEMAGREYFIRGRGYIKSADDIEQVVVGTDESGTPIRIRDVATVQVGPDMRRGVVELDGEGECVGGIVVVRFGENVLAVIERVKEKIKEIEDSGSMPEGAEIVVTYDRSNLIHKAVRNLEHTLIEEMLVVTIVITIFLLHFRSALVAVVMLPVAILISFIPMYYAGLTSNIMSLGGIAIAIGAMVDAACVLIENAHKHLENAPPDADRVPLIIEACKEVGKPIFFSLLIITVAFLPVFTLEGREGRLFKPLAYTKTFSMFTAALLSISLVPAMMVLLLRKGKIWHESEHPISKRIQRVYYPWMSALMRRRVLSISLAVAAVGSCIFVVPKIGSEFMPPLYEGDFLYMPTCKPGASITEATRILQMQDAIFKQFPEVIHVFGKIGRADTPTDPAPLIMVETTIMLKDQDEWRKVPRKRWYSSWAPEFLKKPLRWVWSEERPMTPKELEAEMRPAVKIPGWTDAGLPGPIDIRIDMLSTGIRGQVGIKILGTDVDDLEEIERLGKELEGVLAQVKGTASADAQRVVGGYFLDFTPRREQAARYGLNVEDVNAIVMSAIGGMNIDTTIEGPERHSIAVRYGRELRDTPEKLARVLVPTPTGAQVPMGQLADIRIVPGPPMIENEDGSVAGLLTITLNTDDLGAYVKRAKQAVAKNIKLPEGYRLKWVGKYEAMERTAQRMKLVIPITLCVIVVMLYLNFRSVAQTVIVLLSIPFALTGSIWALYILGYNTSVAVWVGMIALAGVAAETGIVMIVYLDHAFEEFKARGRMRHMDDLFEAITYGAVQRVRPKLMTVVTTICGLLPLMFGHEAGSDVAKRIAAPMIGGLISSTVLTLEIIPAIYSIWRQRQLPKPGDEDYEAPDDD